MPTYIATATAWQMIGWNLGPFRVDGGRQDYQSVVYDSARNPKNVKLIYDKLESDGTVRKIARYIPPGRLLEFEHTAELHHWLNKHPLFFQNYTVTTPHDSKSRRPAARADTRP